MKQYLKLLENIRERGTHKSGARSNMPSSTSLFGYQFRHNLQEGFPLLTTKRMYWNGVVAELLWFMKGNTNIKYLVDNGVNIWNEDAYNYYIKLCDQLDIPYRYKFDEFVELVKNEDEPLNILPPYYVIGDCGRQYGYQWRNFGGHKDQLLDLIEGLINNPTSRRHIISAWNPNDLDAMALPPCHTLVQFNCREIKWSNQHPAIIDFDLKPSEVEDFVRENKYPRYTLDCQLYQRSADAFLGVPFNIASYALLTQIIAKMCNMLPGDFVHTFGDAHIYENHEEAVTTQINREPLELPTLLFKDVFHYHCSEGEMNREAIHNIINDLDTSYFYLKGYESHPRIKAPLSTGLKK